MHDAITGRKRNRSREVIWAVLESGGKTGIPPIVILFSMEWKSKQGRSPCRGLRRWISCRQDYYMTMWLMKLIQEEGKKTISSPLGIAVIYAVGITCITVCYQLLSKYSQDLRHPTSNGRMMRVLKVNCFKWKKVIGQMWQSPRLFEAYRRENGATLLCWVSVWWENVLQGMDELGNQLDISEIPSGWHSNCLDDILGLWSDVRPAKPVLEDVAQGIYTMPLIAAYRRWKELLPLLAKESSYRWWKSRHSKNGGESRWSGNGQRLRD